jgi:hypothetical protein
MKTFKKFVAEQKNTHMTHIEDKVLYGGVKGTRDAILALRSLRDMMKGQHAGNVSVKWDGAPAVFCGTDPTDGKFFVAKKGIFNKNPKVYKTNADIDADASGDLAEKLKLALKHFSGLGIKGVIQGDLLFTKSTIKSEKIDGVDYVTFHPNKIVYAVEKNSQDAREIKAAQIGVVWHTTYIGDSFESMKASYGVDVTKLKKTSAVWQQDAMLRDLTNVATLSEKETATVNKHLSEAGKLFNQVKSSTLRELESNRKLAEMIEQFNNTFVRSNTQIGDTTQHVRNLIQFINDKYQKEIDSKKTEKGKQSWKDKQSEVMKFFSPSNKKSLKAMFDLQKTIVAAKLLLINKLNSIKNIKTFLKTTKGFRSTEPEGYVAIDKLAGNAVKLVNRYEFSTNNFDPTILAGWSK